MRRIICLLVLVLSGCSATDPKCMDGYLVYGVNPHEFKGFCVGIDYSVNGVVGIQCFDTPNVGSKVRMKMVLREATWGQTKCYNTLSEEK